MKRVTFALAAIGLASCGEKEPESSHSARQGEAFGTSISITIEGVNSVGADRILDEAFREVARLESIFTLWDPRSPLRRLNDTGTLDDPPPELLEVLEICGRVHRLTNGVFDPTVQPLWELYEGHFARNPTDRQGPSREEISEARKRIGFEKVVADSGGIRFLAPDMSMTLNAVAPGYAADRIANLLSNQGVESALVDMGETRAIGLRANGQPWEIGIRGPDKGEVIGEVQLDGTALAVSAGYATAFDLEERFHHLFSPSGGTFQPARRIVVVEAREAGLADALATAGGVMPETEFRKIVGSMEGVRVSYFHP